MALSADFDGTGADAPATAGPAVSGGTNWKIKSYLKFMWSNSCRAKMPPSSGGSLRSMPAHLFAAREIWCAILSKLDAFVKSLISKTPSPSPSSAAACGPP
eukprot:CAMPEP_0115762078 /NCGR_PEP_ID=MMETSP0272-20121206/100843_1 /TAXON_ID=71861 /ORGANISM="Scrippsiella trochoidea, Strain CCMP3099" /LENGTH=100 /DNA_ID=CAMNT_0003207791 /DNA_START=82 /DNA_END=381 /DNA_ORIENTATION=+